MEVLDDFVPRSERVNKVEVQNCFDFNKFSFHGHADNSECYTFEHSFILLSILNKSAKQTLRTALYRASVSHRIFKILWEK